jgi:hypothetical protein
MWPFVLAMFGEAIGYALRRVSAEIRYGRGPALGMSSSLSLRRIYRSGRSVDRSILIAFPGK